MLHTAGLVAVLMTAVMTVVVTRQTGVLIEQARKRGVSIARNVAGSSVNSLCAGDWFDLGQEAVEIVAGEDIDHVAVFEVSGRCVAFASKRGEDSSALNRLVTAEERARAKELEAPAVEERPALGDVPRHLSIRHPVIYTAGGVIRLEGWVLLGLSLEGIDRELTAVRIRLAGLWGVALLLGLTSSLLLAGKVTRPIEEVARAAVRFSAGDLDHRVQVGSRDEISSLADNLNHMAQEIRGHLDEIETLNRGLEAKVHARTQELAHANDELRGAMGRLKDTQAQLVHSEKMASLGQLVAGVAHEINNPLNFVVNGVGPLKEAIGDVLEVLERSRSLGSLSEADRRCLAELEEEVDLVGSVDCVSDLMGAIEEGARRAAVIVQHLRSFSRLDEAELKRANIHDGIEGSLSLMRPRLRDRIEIVREFGDVPEFDCRPAHLNQVFMNLLSNAEQAIEGKGTITIRTGVEGKRIFVEVADTGCGIDEQNLDRIFEPFFTTKDVGRGTGLGLSISFGIVESHNGSIEVQTEKGKGSTFTVWIPLVPPGIAESVPGDSVLA
jgi:signal transduction histidine kinase